MEIAEDQVCAIQGMMKNCTVILFHCLWAAGLDLSDELQLKAATAHLSIHILTLLLEIG